MAFGVQREELKDWKQKVKGGDIAFLTHFWLDERFPGCTTVTKVGCNDLKKLKAWGKRYGLREEWIHFDLTYPHFDLFGERQRNILKQENQLEQLKRFNLL
ncbi:hypothetical protein [Lentibacillus sediminis]|uniref:hypothetical protein n=1 Tax=Lentibacillus sediminis TaxID=1940529 RepID=UPI000C1C26D1|nr:hypothetical protein [Lentibacillus sediminis]